MKILTLSILLASMYAWPATSALACEENQTQQQLQSSDFQAWGLITYVGEVGWLKEAKFFGKYTGFQAHNGKWGVMNQAYQVQIPAQFESLIYDGYFFSGHINPKPGMQAVRALAKSHNESIWAFIAEKDTVVGYLSEKLKIRKINKE